MTIKMVKQIDIEKDFEKSWRKAGWFVRFFSNKLVAKLWFVNGSLCEVTKTNNALIDIIKYLKRKK